MKKTIVAIAILNTLAAGAFYDPTLDADVTRTGLNTYEAEVFEFTTGKTYDVDNVQPNSTGTGYTGQVYDYGTGKSYDVEIDSTGSVDIWAY